MAPEQIAGAAGFASDVYGLGAILYEMLTGRPPFSGATHNEILVQVSTREPVTPRHLRPGIPRDLETICLKCLEKEPLRRYATALELADDVQRFLQQLPIQARPASAAYRLAKYSRRHKAFVAGIVALCGAVVLSFAMLLLGLAASRRAAGEAQRAERETRQRLAESHANTANLAEQRGQWLRVLASCDEALRLGHADPVGLRLQRVRAFNALLDSTGATAEIEELARRDDLGDRAGIVLLWQGDILLNRDNAKAVELIRQAVDRGLPPAELAYAKSLLSKTLSDA